MTTNKELRHMMLMESVCIAIGAMCGFLFSGKLSGAIILALGLLSMAVFYDYTMRRYGEIRRLNTYLDRLLAGDTNLEIGDYEEGELSILKTNLYKAASILISQRESLRADKTYLADALADISHQLKTPLTSMMVMNDLLQDETDQEKRQEFLETESAQLTKMNWLIQTLLKISKLDADVVEMKMESVEMDELIKEALRPLSVLMDIKGISLQMPVPGGASLCLSCDKNWTVQALSNIAKNCVEHMAAGGILTVTETANTLYTALTLSDNGSGIAKEDLPHIFERFYRGKKADAESAGIGLSLAKTIIEKQRGEILVSSAEGVGTTFEIRFYKTVI